MNEDRIIGSARDILGKGEQGLGDAVGNDKLKGDGLVDQAAGTIQHGYGVAKDAVAAVVGQAPDAVAEAAQRGRELGRKGDEAVRERLGDHGPLYLLAGAVAIFAVGAFVLKRSSPVSPPKPAPRRRSSKPQS